MIDAARQAQAFLKSRDRAHLDQDMMFRRALIHSIQEIGEAASRVSEPSRSRIPRLPWTKIVGMRHRMVHTYWSINADMVWEVAVRDLPELLALLEEGTADWPLEPEQ